MEQSPRRRRRWSGLAGAIAGGLVVVLYCTVIRPAAYRWQAPSLIKRYRTAPDQKTAQALADLLDQQRVPAKLGNEILELLVTPDVAVRAAYPAGEEPHIAVSHRFCLSLRHTMLPRRRFVWTRGKEQQGGLGGANSLSTGPQLWNLNVPTTPGVYPCALDYRFALVPEKAHSRGWSWEQRSAAAVYRCAFRIPFDVRIAEPEHAEKIERRSSPELDAAMRAAIRPSTAKMCQSRGLPGRGSYDVTGQFAFEVGSLPENVGFRHVYRDQGGLTMEVKDETFRARAGSMGGTATFPVTALRLPQGRYEGTAILQADEAAAYPDAAIKTIWGGTIELPITFVVRVTEPKPKEP